MIILITKNIYQSQHSDSLTKVLQKKSTKWNIKITCKHTWERQRITIKTTMTMVWFGYGMVSGLSCGMEENFAHVLDIVSWYS